MIALKKLLTGLDIRLLSGETVFTDLSVSSVVIDSRKVIAGSLFIAVKGESVDGHQFLVEAAERGAAAVLCSEGHVGSARIGRLAAKNIVVITVADTAEVVAELAARFYGYPARELRFAGVTGTNGKTTVTFLTEQVLLQSGRAVGVIGTINNRYQLPGEQPVILPTSLTTPPPLELQRVLRVMADAGVRDVVMEVSSHALVQGRVDGVMFAVAAFTNLSRDHLDYHQRMEEYLAAKTLLFSRYLQDNGVAVLPEDQQRLAAACPGAEVIRWGRHESADIRLLKAEMQLEQTDISCQVFSQNFHLTTPLVGEYNVENILTAWGLCHGLGVENSFIGVALSRAQAAPGRLERVSVDGFWARKLPVVLVDYAHTPDALEKVLASLASLPHRNLCVVFGCGGDRDSGKRPLMGEIAARLADVVIVTDDNPRTEDPVSIIDAVVAGVAAGGCPVYDRSWLQQRSSDARGCVAIAGRAAAIRQAVCSMAEGDIVLIAGKGHEAYQITVSGKRFFDDRWQAEEALFSWTSAMLAAATGGRIHGGEGSFGEVVTDSRSGNEGGVFVALKGERHDGHLHAKSAVEAGNRCLVVERVIDDLPPAICQIEVEDTLTALGDMAAFRRQRIGAYLSAKKRELEVIAITGSCGKTSIKEMVGAIFSCHYPVGERYPQGTMVKTAGNYNNLIGLPLTLLPLGTEQRVAILEMGMSEPGEIARLAAIARPHIRCISNIHGAHLQGLGSVDGVAAAKGELFANAGEDDILIVNLDDARVVAQTAGHGQRQVSFSLYAERGADFFCRDITTGQRGCCRFLLCHGDSSLPVQLAVAGRHNVSNALCSAAIASAAGVPLKEIVAGLEAFQPVDKRMQMLTAKAGFTLINDCYNANPGSMAAGLQVLASFREGRTLAVLGDMLDLGEESKEAHRQLGRSVAELGIQRLALLGDFATEVRAGALSAGFADDAITLFSDKEALADWLVAAGGAMNSAADAVLVKASRGLALETVVAQLV